MVSDNNHNNHNNHMESLDRKIINSSITFVYDIIRGFKLSPPFVNTTQLTTVKSQKKIFEISDKHVNLHSSQHCCKGPETLTKFYLC